MRITNFGTIAILAIAVRTLAQETPQSQPARPMRTQQPIELGPDDKAAFPAPPGAHVWPVWKNDLYWFTQKLFN
jgi:hypothetical protein